MAEENSLKLNSSQTTSSFTELETTLSTSKEGEESSDKSRSISPEKVLVDDDELDDDNEAEIVSPR